MNNENAVIIHIIGGIAINDRTKTNIHTLTRTAVVVVSWLAVLLCMGVIFYFSSKNGDDSAAQSLTVMNGFFGFLTKHISLEAFRKIAHFCEFCLLGFLFSNAFYQTRRRFAALWPFTLSLLCSVGDETHQLFVEGRACRPFDILVDTSGILFGLLVFYILTRIIFTLIRKKRA